MKKEWKIFAIVYFIYVISYFLHFNGLKHDWPTMLDVHYDVVRSLVENKSLNMSEKFYYCAELYNKTQQNTVYCKDSKYALGKDNYTIYARYPPGLSFASLPAYYFAYLLFPNNREIKLMSLVAFNTLIAMGVLYYLYLFGKRYIKSSKRLNVFIIIAAFSSILWTYSQTYANDVLTTLLIVGSTYHLLKGIEKRSIFHLIAAGIMLGYVWLLKPPFALIGVFYLLIMISKKLKEIIYFGSAYLIALAVSSIYYWRLFGSPFVTGYHRSISYKTLQLSPLEHFHHNFLIGTIIVIGLYLIFNPYFVLFIKDWMKGIKTKNTEDIVVLTIFFIVTGFLSVWKYPLGAWSFGVRIGMPFIMSYFIIIAKYFDKAWNKKVFWVLVGYSLAIHTIGTLNFKVWDYQFKLDKLIGKILSDF